MAKKRGLGRGLDALLNASVGDPTQTTHQLQKKRLATSALTRFIVASFNRANTSTRRASMSLHNRSSPKA